MYTTHDEITYLRAFGRHRTIAELEKLREAYRKRSWDGHGMNVDGAKVLEELDLMIACARAVKSGAVILVAASEE